MTFEYKWRFHAKNKTNKFDIADNQTVAFLNKEKKSYSRDQCILGFPALPRLCFFWWFDMGFREIGWLARFVRVFVLRIHGCEVF